MSQLLSGPSLPRGPSSPACTVYCFQICDKSTYEDTAVKLAWYFSLALQFVRLKNRVSPFALTKHVNAVSLKLHWSVGRKCHWLCWNFCRIFILQIKPFTKCICCFSQLSHRRFNPVHFDCVLRAVQCVLCARIALCAQSLRVTQFFRGFTMVHFFGSAIYWYRASLLCAQGTKYALHCAQYTLKLHWLDPRWECVEKQEIHSS